MHTYAQKTSQSHTQTTSDLTRPNKVTSPANHPAHNLLLLQRTIGNQAVLRLLKQRSQGLREALPSSTLAPVGEAYVGPSPDAIPSIVHEVLNTQGHPLDLQTRIFMEARVGNGQVRTHSDLPRAARSDLPIGPEKSEHEHEASRMESMVMRAPGPNSSGEEPGANQDVGGQSNTGHVHDFGQVRIHTDAKSEASARALGALAYTVGQHIVFGGGQYNPMSARGRGLLAHELTHVVQQDKGSHRTIQRKIEVGPGLTLDTKGYNTSKSGNVYTAPVVVKNGSIWNEIFTSLFASPRVFKLIGTTNQEINSSLSKHILARYGVISFAALKRYSFGAGYDFKMNPKYWTVDKGGKFKGKEGFKPLEGIDDLNKQPHLYAIGCEAATKLTLIGGARGDNYVESSSSDESDWIPGESGYIKNLKFSGVEGQEGENIIYVGNDMYWGHLEKKNTYKKLMDWRFEVLGWGDGKTEAPGAEELTDQRWYPSTGLQP